MHPGLLTCEEAAQQYGVTSRLIRWATQRGAVPSTRGPRRPGSKGPRMVRYVDTVDLDKLRAAGYLHGSRP